MLKKDEIEKHDSCLNRANDDERLFVLLARDLSAPVAIHAWVRDRIKTGKNRLSDPEIISAMATADAMEHERDDAKSGAHARHVAGRVLSMMPDVSGVPSGYTVCLMRNGAITRADMCSADDLKTLAGSVLRQSPAHK